ncbi:MAG TPA: hypothetical protein VNQ34_07235 [Xanthobacteraceae bacterium]|nr:hypothetical protein [Xanthobacteraceae bacterium]
MDLALRKSSAPKEIENILDEFRPEINEGEAGMAILYGAKNAIYAQKEERQKRKLNLLHERNRNVSDPGGSTQRVAEIDKIFEEIGIQNETDDKKLDEITRGSVGLVTEDMVIAAGKKRGFRATLWPHDEGANDQDELQEIMGEKIKAIKKGAAHIADNTVAPLDLGEFVREKMAASARDFNPIPAATNPKRPGVYKPQTIFGPARVIGHGAIDSFGDAWSVAALLIPERVEEALAGKLEAHMGKKPVLTRAEQLEKLWELYEEKLQLEHRCESIFRNLKAKGIVLQRPAMSLEARLGFRFKKKPTLADLDRSLSTFLADREY